MGGVLRVRPRWLAGYLTVALGCCLALGCGEATNGGPGDAGVSGDSAPQTARGKFCTGVAGADGGSYSMTLKVGVLSLTAATGTCTSCQSLPVGNAGFTVEVAGVGTKASGTVAIVGGNEYLYWSDLDPRSRLVLRGGKIESPYTCETAKPTFE
jgi:hypothetical protein